MVLGPLQDQVNQKLWSCSCFSIHTVVLICFNLCLPPSSGLSQMQLELETSASRYVQLFAPT